MSLESGSSPPQGWSRETGRGEAAGSCLPWKGNEDIHSAVNPVNYFCLGAQRKGLGRAASKTIVPSRKKKG